MRRRRTFSKLSVVASVLALGFASPAFAHRVVHVQGTLYVIVCNGNGGAFTFNGTAQGAGEIGSYLCPTAVVSGGGATGGVIEAVPADRAIEERKAAGGTGKACPKGTYWYEPAKACVPVGGHPG